MTPLDREAAGQRIARARRRRGLSQAVLAGLVSRSESWLSQVERGKRGIDSHSVLVLAATVFAHESAAFGVHVLAGLGGDLRLGGWPGCRAGAGAGCAEEGGERGDGFE